MLSRLYRVLLTTLAVIQNFIIAIGTLLTTLLVAASVVRGDTTPAQFVVFVSYLQQIYGPLSMLGTLYRVVQQNLVDTDKLVSLAICCNTSAPTCECQLTSPCECR